MYCVTWTTRDLYTRGYTYHSKSFFYLDLARTFARRVKGTIS